MPSIVVVFAFIFLTSTHQLCTFASAIYPEEESNFVRAAEGGATYDQVVSNLQKGGSGIGKGVGYVALSTAQSVSALADAVTDMSLQGADFVRTTKKSIFDSVWRGISSLANVVDSTADKGIKKVGEANKNVKDYKNGLFNRFEKALQ